MEPGRLYDSSFSQTGTMVSLVDANTRMSAEKAEDREVSGISKLPEVAGDLRNRAFIGTSGWAYSSWKPAFYPQALPQKKFLEYYAAQLNSVEVNYTFRQLLTDRMLAGWLAGCDRRPLSLLVQSAAAAHSLPSTRGLFRHTRRLVACAGSCRGCWTDGCGALPASAQFQGRRASP